MIQLPTSIQEDKDAGKTYPLEFASCECGDSKGGTMTEVASWLVTHRMVHSVRALRVELAKPRSLRVQ